MINRRNLRSFMEGASSITALSSREANAVSDPMEVEDQSARILADRRTRLQQKKDELMANPTQSVEEAFIEEAFTAKLADALETHIFSKEHRVDEWPADEAHAYRSNGGFMKGNAAVKELRIQKVADELLPLVLESKKPE